MGSGSVVAVKRPDRPRSRASDGTDGPAPCGAAEIRLIDPACAEYNRALHLAMDLPIPSSSSPAPAVLDLLATVSRGTANIDLLFGAFDGGDLVSAALAIESPGRAALISIPIEHYQEAPHSVMGGLLQACKEEAWRRSIILLEVLTSPAAGRVEEALLEAGFRRLTRLHYLRRSAGGRFRRRAEAVPELDWVIYSEGTHSLFETALERTYVQSMDCPELTGLRRTRDVLAGHRASGVFDPETWWVACRGGDPVGVLLLNQFSDRSGTEIVYMGVSCGARRQGIGGALLDRADSATRKLGAHLIALAVDARNIAARRMYERWGFREANVREAWIAFRPANRRSKR